MRRMWRAIINSWNGLVAVTRSEEAFRQELLLLAIAVPLAFWITEDVGKRYMLIGTVILLMVVELLNTAIEKLGDRITRERDEAIGRIKDMGSAAVGVSLVFAAAVWVWIVGERFWSQWP
jgi:diacylglycerol kinase (ATP)